MGNGISKVEAARVPVPEEPVNIIITQDVKKRLEAMYFQMEKGKQAADTTNVTDEVKVNHEGLGSWNSNLDNKKVMNGNATQVEKKESNGNVAGGDERGKSSYSSVSSESLGGIAHSFMESESEMKQSSSIQPSGTSLDVQGESDVSNFANMKKISNYFVPKNSKRRFDLENGNNDENYYGINDENKYAAFIRKQKDDWEDPALYEEVDETVEGNNGKKKHEEELIDEEATIGRYTGDATRKFNNSWVMKEVRVPRPVLPVVVDQDKEGKVTVETITAWRLRERFEEEISLNDEYWKDELERITSKIEKETRVQADDFQKRIEELRKRHSDVIEPPFRDGAHCNLLVAQIGKCYQKNEGQVLRCNDLVRQFAYCTNKSV